MIPQRKISLLSNRLVKAGGWRIPEQVLERDYCLAWFLAALARSDLQPLLAFKGGTALKRCYFGDYRFSEDLDFTLLREISFEELMKRLEPVYATVREESGIVFSFDREDCRKHANTYTCYLKYVGPLPAGNDVKVDVTLREHLIHPLANLPVLRGYEEFSDLPEERMIRVYSLDEIATEKTIALADGARNEPRDLYDLWHLTSNVGIGLAPLKEGMRQKLQFRGKPIEDLTSAVRNKEARLRALWEKRLAYQMTKLPKFDDVFRAVQRTFRQADIN